MSKMENTKRVKHRVCIIGAGPSGMSALYQHAKLNGDNVPEVVCYEKQSTWGGLWNLTWMTGTDEFGENCHGTMYKYMWTNGPKECQEYHDYTFQDHYGKQIPSYLPRHAMREYLEGRWTSFPDLKKSIKFNHVVRNVSFNQATEEFSVKVADLSNKETFVERFSHVIVASGIFSVPNKPSYPGFDEFEGRILHAHDFRDALEFRGQRVLLVGISYSAEDIAITCVKYGAKSAICTWRKHPMGFNWPEGVEERPSLQKMSKNTAVFQDGSVADVDVIILCTGYQYSFPFMEDDLQMKTGPILFYPENLYKGVVWMKGGNHKLFYIGSQYQIYTWPIFDIQAAWVWRYILGQLKNGPKSQKEMEADIQVWRVKFSDFANHREAVDMQGEYLDNLIAECGYNENVTKAKELWHKVLLDRDVSLGTCRDHVFTSVHSGATGCKTPPWMTLFEEDLDKINKM